MTASAAQEKIKELEQQRDRLVAQLHFTAGAIEAYKELLASLTETPQD